MQGEIQKMEETGEEKAIRPRAVEVRKSGANLMHGVYDGLSSITGKVTVLIPIVVCGNFFNPGDNLVWN